MKITDAFHSLRQGLTDYVFHARTTAKLDDPEKGLYAPVSFSVWRDGGGEPRVLGRFTFAPMPGCCGVVVSTDSYLQESWRSIPVVSEHFHKLKEQTAKKLGYSMMVATCQLRNIPEVVSASKAKWKIDHMFRNSRTGNDIGMMFKELK